MVVNLMSFLPYDFSYCINLETPVFTLRIILTIKGKPHKVYYNKRERKNFDCSLLLSTYKNFPHVCIQ